MKPRLLTFDEVRRRVPFTRQWLRELDARGEFPKRVALGPRRVAWREDQIDAWIDGRTAKADGSEAA
ncbi:MAG: helix-turn-helix transcriptional regulator [Pikeienuella sp.]